MKAGTSVVINLKNCTQPSQPYVALSRAQNIQQIFIVGELHEQRWFPSNSALQELKNCEDQEQELTNGDDSDTSLIIMSLNVRSLQKHIAEVQRIVHMKPCDVVCLQETWMPANSSDFTSYKLGGYNIHLNSVGRGKGIASYTSDNFQLVSQIKEANIQISKFSSNFLDIFNVYRSADCKNFETILNSLLNKSKETVIVGDMNINLNKAGPKRSQLLNFLKESGLSQLVVRSTHQSEHEEASLIDHVYASQQISHKITVTKQCVGFSDHDVLFVKIKK